MPFPIPFRNSIDLEQNQLVRAVIDLNTGSDPATPANGQFWYRDDAGVGTAFKRLAFYDGATVVRVPRLDKGETVSSQWTFGFAGAPFFVSNTAVVTNLNADLLDGFNTSASAAASTIIVRDANARGKVADPSASDDIVNLGYMQAYVGGATSPKAAMRMAAGAALPANTRTSNVLTADANGSWNAMISKVVTNATNATPIVVGATAHGYTSGDQVLIENVGGNTAANGTWSIDVIDPDSFSLNGSAGNGAYTSGGTAGQSLDGLVGALNDRVLVLSEVLGANNGLFYISDLGSAGTPWTLTRTTDADTSAEVLHGLSTFVTNGKLYGNSGWLLITPDPITLNTTTLTFVQNSGSSQIIAGNGIVKDGNFIHAVTSSNYTAGSFIYASGTTTLAQAQITGLVQGNGVSAPTAVTGTQYGLPYWATATTVGTTAAGTATQVLHGNASGAPSWGQIVNADITNATINVTTKITGAVPIANGGTGQTTAITGFNALSPLTTRGDLLTRDATNNIRLAIGTSGKFIRSDGTDASWQNIAATDITSGVLPIARGGTNSTTAPTAGGVAYGDATAYQFTAAGTAGYFLQSAGAGAPVWFNLFGTSNTWSTTQIYSAFSAGGVALQFKADTDTTSRFQITRAGTMSWGPGGSTAVDTTLYRTAAAILKTDGNLRIDGLTASQIVLTDANKQLVSSAGLSIALGGTAGTATPTAGGVAYGTGTAYAFTAAGTSGYMLTSGGAGAPAWFDLFGTANTFTVQQTITRTTSTAALQLRLNTDAASRLALFATGGLLWGDGTAAGDTDLYRQGAGMLRTSGRMRLDGLTPSQLVVTAANSELTSLATLTLALGGTGAALTAVNGGVVWSNATTLAVTAAGSSGEVLKSNGAAAPTWVSLSSLGFLTGSGTTDYMAKWTSSGVLGASLLYEAGGVLSMQALNNQLSFRVYESGTTYMGFGASSPLLLIGGAGTAGGVQLGYYDTSAVFNSKFTLSGAIAQLTSVNFITAASVSAYSGLTVTPGADPSSPNDGDLWTKTTGAFIRINAVTYQVTPTTVATPGGVAYGVGTGPERFGFTAAGSAGQFLVSNGASAPSWTSTPTGISRKYETTFTGTAYIVNHYIDITHSLGTYGVKVEVYRIKDTAGAADANQQSLIMSTLRPTALGTSKVRLYMGLDPDPDEEFAVVVFG